MPPSVLGGATASPGFEFLSDHLFILGHRNKQSSFFSYTFLSSFLFLDLVQLHDARFVHFVDHRFVLAVGIWSVQSLSDSISARTCPVDSLQRFLLGSFVFFFHYDNPSVLSGVLILIDLLPLSHKWVKFFFITFSLHGTW